MKNLVKIALSLAIVLLISLNVNAQNASDKTGTVTLDVETYLVFSLSETSLTFTFNKYSASDPEPQSTIVEVQSNIDWTASVAVTSSDLIGVDGLGIGVLICNSNPMVLNSAIQQSGSMTDVAEFSYDFEGIGNPAPGSYITNLNYSIATF